MKRIRLVLACAGGLAAAAAAQAQATVYRCPGPPVLYTDALSAQQAKDRGCRTIEGAPVTVMQSPRPRAAAAGAAPAAVPASAARPERGDGERVAEPQQRERDSDARRILEAELAREAARLQQLRAEFNEGAPERQGNERNYQRYLDRAAGLKAAIERSEADIAALQRELTRLRP